MKKQKIVSQSKKIDSLLNQAAVGFFSAITLSGAVKKNIFSKIKKAIFKKRKLLEMLIVKEAKFTLSDAKKEVERAYRTFELAERYADFVIKKVINNNGKRIEEKRIPRGPLLAITPFSSPLSSPAHKIALGIIAGTSIIFKPSSSVKSTSKELFKIINSATKGKYVYYCGDNSKSEIQSIIKDERVGIISFTGNYKTGQKIIKQGGVKKYHMELTGGNSLVIFAPDFKAYDRQLKENLVSAIITKNGQRCISLKHIFIPSKYQKFIGEMQSYLFSLKHNIKKDLSFAKENILGPLVSMQTARLTEDKVNEIIHSTSNISFLVPWERKGDYVFPAMCKVNNFNAQLIRKILEYDLTGPVVFIHYYKNKSEYLKILSALSNDYVRSGLQLSFYTENILDIKKRCSKLIWGGIIINNLPTLRNEFMSFGGFGRSGLGKEGFFETIFAYTDPQSVVYKL